MRAQEVAAELVSSAPAEPLHLQHIEVWRDRLEEARLLKVIVVVGGRDRLESTILPRAIEPVKSVGEALDHQVRAAGLHYPMDLTQRLLLPFPIEDVDEAALAVDQVEAAVRKLQRARIALLQLGFQISFRSQRQQVVAEIHTAKTLPRMLMLHPLQRVSIAAAKVEHLQPLSLGHHANELRKQL